MRGVQQDLFYPHPDTRLPAGPALSPAHAPWLEGQGAGMNAIVSQVRAIRDYACRRFATTDELHAIAAALKQAAHEADRALTNRLQADRAQRDGGAA
jgi:hypothetical protein